MSFQDAPTINAKRLADVPRQRPAEIQKNIRPVERISGKISAAFLASGIGCLVIGIMTTGAVISAGLNNLLNWWNPAGPLTGKTGIGVAAWLISWRILHSRWRGTREVGFGKVFAATLILICLGFILTFPPVFEAFE
ncbi:MAG: hypothetical protein V2I40_00750 [Desulfobacteraceae bacterium]|jgi:hypothetical protein|nr:hypothetical protein [Desulfobacteraceae bacterium]